MNPATTPTTSPPEASLNAPGSPAPPPALPHLSPADLIAVFRRSYKLPQYLLFLALLTGPFLCGLVHIVWKLQRRLGQSLSNTPVPPAEKLANAGWALLLLVTAFTLLWLEVRIIKYAVDEGRREACEEVGLVAEERRREVFGEEGGEGVRRRMTRRQTGESWLWW